MKPGFAAAADDLLTRTVHGPNGVPGVVAALTGRDRMLYEGCAGLRALDGAHVMSADTVMSAFSCTKAITATAVMRLVEAGRLDLDEPARNFVPALEPVEVLDGFDPDGEPRLRKPKSAITTRQLLLHTAGFGYEFFNADLRRFAESEYARNRPANPLPPARSVLLRDPGTRWEYGSNIDWAGMVVEAVRGKPLGDVLREEIFEPLGMRDTGFRLTTAMGERRAVIHQRGPGGELTPKPRLGLPPDDGRDFGGSGLFTTAADYLAFIRMILNDGAAAGGGRVLASRTVAFMTTNGLGTLDVKPLPGTMPLLTNDAEFFPGLAKSWGYSWMINDTRAPTGRPAGQVSWAGLANLFYWIDRVNGIGGFWATQILPFIDGVSFPAYSAFETAAYDFLCG